MIFKRIGIEILRGRLKSGLKSPLVSVFGIFAGSNMLVTVLMGVGSLLQARWVPPNLMGELQKYSIPLTYVSLALIPIVDGFTRQFPYLIGKGQVEEAKIIAGIAKTWQLCVCFIASTVFAVLSANACLDNNWYAAVGWGLQVFAVIQQTYGNFLQTIYRRSMEFKRLSYNAIISSVITTIALISVRFFQYYGLALKLFTLYVSRVILDAKYLPMKIHATWDWKRFLSLAKISIPLSGVGYIQTSLTTSVFSYLVLRYCGTKELGLFGVAMSFRGVAMLFNGAIGQIFSVKIANKYGETESVLKTVRMLIAPTAISFGMSLVCVVVLCVCIGPFVTTFLPKYIDAIPIVYVLSFSMPISAIGMPVGILRMALQYRRVYFIAISKLVVLVGTIWLVPKTIVWLAACSMIVEVFGFLLGYIYVIKDVLAERKAGKNGRN